MAGHLESDRIEFFQGISLPETPHLFYRNDVSVQYEINSEICSGNEPLPDIGHIKGNYGRWSFK